MGPQHESCGKEMKAYWKKKSAELQWGRNMRVAESAVGRRGKNARWASMGPQHESCGKRDNLLSKLWQSELQWGRNMRVAERNSYSKRGTTSRSFNGAAT